MADDCKTELIYYEGALQMSEKDWKRLVWHELFHYGFRPDLATRKRITELLLTRSITNDTNMQMLWR
jgi:hypothetical protein